MNTNNIDDEKWFEALTGHLPEKEKLDQSALEGKILRDAILSENKKTLDTLEDPKQEDLERLLFKLRREGLLEKKPQTRAATKPKTTKFWGMPMPAAIAAGIAVAVILPFTFQNITTQTPSDSGMTGTIAQSPQMFQSQPPKASIGKLSIISSDNPEQTAIELSQALQTLEITNKIYQLNGKWHLDANADISKSSFEQVTKLSQEYGFDISKDGSINIVIESN